MKAKLILTPFIKLRNTEKTFFITLLGFTPFWNFKPSKTIHVNNRVYTLMKNN